MENNLFINMAIDTALGKYITLKETNDYSLAKDFLVYVIGLLSYIYGEENIISLYEKNDERSFKYLLNKYNVDPYYADKFYSDFDKYYNLNIKAKALGLNEKNPYFIYLQEDLINMFLAKYQELKFDKKKLDKFKNMLFIPTSDDKFIVDFNNKMADNPNYISEYYDSKVYEVLNPIDFTLERENVLSQEVYDAFDLSKDKLDKLSFKELESINNRIYNYFNVSPIEPNVNKKILDRIKKMDTSKLTKKINNSKVTNFFIFVIIFLVFVIVAILIGLKIVGVI
ncbi:MAG: hypothetical protein IJ572_05630 [Bacilli bacterium]|nr:hypothetical protein [Bacilli bacterium]